MIPLPSTINTPETEKRVLKAARSRFPNAQAIRANFEHGHWWIEVDHGGFKSPLERFCITEEPIPRGVGTCGHYVDHQGFIAGMVRCDVCKRLVRLVYVMNDREARPKIPNATRVFRWIVQGLRIRVTEEPVPGKGVP